MNSAIQNVSDKKTATWKRNRQKKYIIPDETANDINLNVVFAVADEQ